MQQGRSSQERAPQEGLPMGQGAQALRDPREGPQEGPPPQAPVAPPARAEPSSMVVLRRDDSNKEDQMKRRKKRHCSPEGLKASGRLHKGYRWARGRKGCPIRTERPKS